MAMKPWVLGGIGALVFGLSVVRLGAQATPTPTPAPAEGDSSATTPAAARRRPPRPPPRRKVSLSRSRPASRATRTGQDASPAILTRASAVRSTARPGWATRPARSCHGPGTKHMESSGEDKSDLRVFKGPAGCDFCTTCHDSNRRTPRTGRACTPRGGGQLPHLPLDPLARSEGGSPERQAGPRSSGQSCHPS